MELLRNVRLRNVMGYGPCTDMLHVLLLKWLRKAALKAFAVRRKELVVSGGAEHVRDAAG